MSFWNKLFGHTVDTATTSAANLSNKSEFEDLVLKDYGLTCGSAGWTYKGKGNNAIANQLHDPALCFELIKTTFSSKGMCLVATNPTMIVLNTDDGPFCIITSLDSKGISDFAALILKEFTFHETPPEHNGCMLFKINFP